MRRQELTGWAVSLWWALMGFVLGFQVALICVSIWPPA